MKVINKRLLKQFAQAPRCEYCGRSTPQGCDPAHIYSRGAGRVDCEENLVSLCRWCHSLSHSANSVNGVHPNRDDLLAIASKRTGKTPEEITDKVHRFRRDDKCKVWKIS